MQNKNVRFFVCAAGIFVSYFYFGILQEKIMKGQYVSEQTDENGEKVKVTEKYTYALTLVLIQCVVNYLFAKFMLTFWPQAKPNDCPSLKSYYAISALTYLLAMLSSTMALQWVSYPTQVVGKSCKPIPVMILGVLLGKKSYPLRKYLFILLIVIGITLFMYKSQHKADSRATEFGLGEILLLLSLTMDGLTGAVQERMRTEASPSGQHIMEGMNMWSSIFSTIGILCTGEIFHFVNFVNKFPSVVWNLASLALTGALGQLFIFLTVSEFGPLPCAIITTTRKFFTVLGSVILFGNVLLGRQWIGATIVFTGLFLDALYSKSSKPKQ